MRTDHKVSVCCRSLPAPSQRGLCNNGTTDYRSSYPGPLREYSGEGLISAPGGKCVDVMEYTRAPSRKDLFVWCTPCLHTPSRVLTNNTSDIGFSRAARCTRMECKSSLKVRICFTSFLACSPSGVLYTLVVDMLPVTRMDSSVDITQSRLIRMFPTTT